jgi:hypothetical protein
VFCRHVMLAWPISPVVANFTPSFDTEIVTVSPMELKSAQIRLNSDEGIFTVAAYSVSGMPRCSESMSISLSSKSEILSWSVGGRVWDCWVEGQGRWLVIRVIM